MFKDAVNIACKQYSGALDTFIKVNPSIKSSFVKDLSAQLNSSMAIITHCCEMIRDFFDDTLHTDTKKCLSASLCKDT